MVMLPANDDSQMSCVEHEAAVAAQAAPKSYLPWFSLVFLLNLPVPFFWGVMVNEKRNTFFLLAGCALLLALGRLICTRSRRVGFSLTAGGVVVAISQFFPMMQITVGILVVEGFGAATGLVESSEHRAGFENGISPWACLVFTLLTGLILMAIALVTGELIRQVFFRKKDV